MRKEDVIAKLENKQYSKKETAHLIGMVSEKVNIPPSKYKKGDVYADNCGGKKRPVVIIKVLKDFVIGIPLSTKKDCLNLHPYKSRFFGEGWFSKQFCILNIEYLDKAFIGVFDNNKNLNEAIKKLKEFTYDTL